jgi:hypothetical protein
MQADERDTVCRSAERRKCKRQVAGVGIKAPL